MTNLPQNYSAAGQEPGEGIETDSDWTVAAAVVLETEVG